MHDEWTELTVRTGRINIDGFVVAYPPKHGDGGLILTIRLFRVGRFDFKVFSFSQPTASTLQTSPEKSAEEDIWKFKHHEDHCQTQNTHHDTAADITHDHQQQQQQSDAVTGPDSRRELVTPSATTGLNPSLEPPKTPVKQPPPSPARSSSIPTPSDANTVGEHEQIVAQAAANRPIRAAVASNRPDGGAGGRRRVAAHSSMAGERDGYGGGYKSDGDTLKTSTGGSQLRVFGGEDEANNGYNSEGSMMTLNGGGGGGAAGRRLTSRPRERMPYLRESGPGSMLNANARFDG